MAIFAVHFFDVSVGFWLRRIIQFLYFFAEVAHLVEHDLAKVGVAGSSPVFRSENHPAKCGIFFQVAPVVELVDTQDLKSCDPQRS